MLMRVTTGLLVLTVLGVALYVATPIPVEESPLSLHAIVAEHQPQSFDNSVDGVEALFPVDWPPSPSPTRGNSAKRPLLSGKLIAASGGEALSQVCVRIELTRGDSAAERQRWNSQLEFPEHDWMSHVHVWDEEKEWLWPNLPYLLRAHGMEREQRYGGVDPGKGVDNDFAAIVVRPNNLAVDDTILAEWHAPPMGMIDKRSIVHTAVSDDCLFAIPTDQVDCPQAGRLEVWLIYADFLGYDPPRSWPQEPEFDGGILAFFVVQWALNEDRSVAIVDVEHKQPTSSTGVDWELWWTTKFR